jgi:hypothetical protein
MIWRRQKECRIPSTYITAPPLLEDTNCAKTTTRENNDNEPGRQQENPTLISLLCLGAIMGY